MKLMSSLGVSVEKYPSSSTASGNEPYDNSSSMSVQQLKMKDFNVDILQTNPSVVSDIKAMLKQLNNHDLLDSVVGFILNFEPSLDQTSQALKLKKESLRKLKQKDNPTMDPSRSISRPN
ncbi:hypothetical protein RYX36_000669 [Vicia faba]